jgi:putative ABC transport system permease protein
MPLLRGRLFTARDDSASPRVAIISRALAEQFRPNDDPVGKQIHRLGTGGAPAMPFEIVGVVANAMEGGYEAHQAKPCTCRTPRCRTRAYL